MKPIFDGVYINQILLQAQVYSIVSAAQRAPVFLSLSLSRLGSLRRTSSLVPLTVRSSNSPLKPESKRGSIFIRRFLMKHFKCMEFVVAITEALGVPPRAMTVFFRWLLTTALSPTRLTLKRYESFSSVSPCACAYTCGIWPVVTSRSRSIRRGEDTSGYHRIYAGLIKLRFHLREWKIDFKRQWEGMSAEVSYKFTVPCQEHVVVESFFSRHI